MKKKILLLPLLAFILSGCSFEDLMFWKKKEDNPGQKQETPSGNENLDNLKNPFTTTINFYGDSLPSEWTSTGLHMDSTVEAYSSDNSKLVKVATDQVNNSNLLSELFFKNNHLGKYDDSGMILQIGSGNPAPDKQTFQSGTFVWTSIKKIYKVDVTAQCYTKELGATDSSAHLKIEAGEKGTDTAENRPINSKVTNDLSFAAGESGPEYKSYSNTYPKGVERFSLTSLDGRVFLKSITITWDL